MARIMLVDDAVFMRAMLRDIITKAGHTIVGEADNGKEAVQLYRQIKPDLIIMDITMPEMDGVEATMKIHNMDPDSKIIICSAMGQQAMVINAVKAGAKDFIVKPVNEERIIDAIYKVLRGYIHI